MSCTNERSQLSLSIIEDLKAKGFTQSDIADIFGVTRQAVSWHKTTYGGRMTPRETILKHFPWQVPTRFSQTAQYRLMRDHGEYMATRGKGMRKNQLSRLQSFYRKLRVEGLVLEYDPSIPPCPGVSNKGGFAYRERTPEDGNLLIRVNEHTVMTEEGRIIWCLPPVDPYP